MKTIELTLKVTVNVGDPYGERIVKGWDKVFVDLPLRTLELRRLGDLERLPAVFTSFNTTEVNVLPK